MVLHEYLEAKTAAGISQNSEKSFKSKYLVLFWWEFEKNILEEMKNLIKFQQHFLLKKCFYKRL